MWRIRWYHLKQKIKGFAEQRDVKTIVALLGIELALLLFMAYKNLAVQYFPVTLFLMLLTAVGCGIAFHYHADKYLLVIVLMLLNFGFLIQGVESGKNLAVMSFIQKASAVFLVAFAAVFLYKKLATLVAEDWAIYVMMAVQILLCAAIFIFAGKTGGDSKQAAKIEVFGITLFEPVKLIYIFVASGLLCKEEKGAYRIPGIKFPILREYLLLAHTAVLAVFFVLCSELGTLLVIYFTLLIMLGAYGKNRKLTNGLILLSVIGFFGFWLLCENVLYPMVTEGTISFGNTINKVIARFGATLHPENSMQSYGYHGTALLKAIAIGSWFGIGTERYRLGADLPTADTDSAFANIVQTCGIFMGLLVILFFFAFLKRGIEIASKNKDLYFQGIILSITGLITVETIIHIGYNIGFLPITGIPLYFVSKGFTAVFSAVVLVTVMLLASTGSMKRNIDKGEDCI